MRLADPYMYTKSIILDQLLSLLLPLALLASTLKVALHVHFKEQVDMNSGLLGAKKISMDLLIYKVVET